MAKKNAGRQKNVKNPLHQYSTPIHSSSSSHRFLTENGVIAILFPQPNKERPDPTHRPAHVSDAPSAITHQSKTRAHQKLCHRPLSLAPSPSLTRPLRSLSLSRLPRLHLSIHQFPYTIPGAKENLNFRVQKKFEKKFSK